MTSPYSPIPNTSSKTESLPAIMDVQVGKAKSKDFDPPARRFDDIVQTSAISIAAASEMDIARVYVSRAGCSPDYCRVTGQLSYVHTGGGLWVVRYASLDREDRYGGSVVLAPVVNMDSYKEGDLVTVTGEVLNDGRRASKFLGGPLYRTTSINLVDRLSKGSQ